MCIRDRSVTENTRVSYPINHIENIVRPVSTAPAAKDVIFLSADEFGVLPPVSILTPEQTQYYFLSGFTAKLAGTERGITEPTPVSYTHLDVYKRQKLDVVMANDITGPMALPILKQMSDTVFDKDKVEIGRAHV